jgi:hypothetical protein
MIINNKNTIDDTYILVDKINGTLNFEDLTIVDLSDDEVRILNYAYALNGSSLRYISVTQS